MFLAPAHRGTANSRVRRKLEIEGVVASQSILDITGTGFSRYLVTGTSTIALIHMRPWQVVTVRFQSALTLQYNPALLVLPGAVDMPVSAGDIATFIADGKGLPILASIQHAVAGVGSDLTLGLAANGFVKRTAANTYAVVADPLPLANGGTNAISALAARAASGLNIESGTPVGDTNYTILSTDRLVYTNAAFTGGRLWTLPLASSVNAGGLIIVADMQGTTTTSNFLQIGRAGSDLINGFSAVSLQYTNGYMILISDGVSRWTALAPFIMGADAGSGGSRGLVPAPGAGDTAAGKFLKANATWAVPQPVFSPTGHGDSIYTITATDRFVYTNAAFTASRAWTLPAANAVVAGTALVIADLQGTLTTANSLVITRAGSDTINGATTLTVDSAFAFVMLISDGTSKWIVSAQDLSALSLGTLPIANGGTNQATAAAARSSSGLNIEGATGHGDSNYTILSTDRWVYTNAAFTAPRTWTLPAANSVNAGQIIYVGDYQGTLTTTNTLTVQRAGADTINGGTIVTINTLYAFIGFISDGASKWQAMFPFVFVGDSGTGGIRGLVPSPGAGDAAAGKFLKADASWAVPYPTEGAGLSVVGRSANSAGVSADITGTLGQVLRVGAGPVLGFGAVDLTAAAAVSGNLGLGNGGTGQGSAAAARGPSGLNVESGTGHGDSIYTLAVGDRYVYTNAAFTASRAWTLPAANSVNAGGQIIIADAQGTLTSANTLVITRAGADTIDGATTLTLDAAYAFAELVSDGTSKWTASKQDLSSMSVGILPLANGGTAQATALAARGSTGLNVESGTGHGDSIYTILATDRFVYTNAAFTTSRTWTLPAANAVNAGGRIVIADLQGTVTLTNTLIISRAGADTINGGTTITLDAASSSIELISDGTSKWSARLIDSNQIAGIVASANGGTGVNNGTNTLTLAGNLATSGAFPITVTAGASTSVTLPASGTLLSTAVTATITVGYTVTAFSNGTVSSGTLTPSAANGNYQYYTNNGAHTLAAPTSDCGISIEVLNGASAGAITFSGFTVGASVGDALTTTNTQKFRIRIERINGNSTYMIQAMQ